MSPEQQRAILEAAAKACGIECEIEVFNNGRAFGTNEYNEIVFDPINNSLDTASMCAKLEIGTEFHTALGFVVCRKSLEVAHVEFHDGTDADKEAAWRLAASMVAAKVGGYTDDI